MNDQDYENMKRSAKAAMEEQGITSADLYAAFREEMEASPEWKVLYPRVYQSAAGYGSPKRVAETYYTAVDWVKSDPATAPAAFRTVYCAACKARENNFPMFFVDKELLSAVLNTNPPSGVRWDELNLPFEAGVFVLPLGTMRYVDGSAVNHLGWCRARKGDALRFDETTPPVNAPDDSFAVYAQPLNEDGTVLFSNVDATRRPYIDDDTIINSLWGGAFDIPLSSDDDGFLRQARALVFGLLLAMSARPQLVSYGQRQGKQSKKGRREFWTPNIIGRGFRVERESTGEKGTHASPRLHWRRGHFRAQRYGEKLQQIKTIWIEPTLVGGQESDNE